MELSEAEIIVKFEYIEGEDPVYDYGDGSGYPGSPDQVNITSIKYLGYGEPIEVYQLIRELDLLEKIVEHCHEHMED